MIGDSATLANDAFYQRMLTYFEAIGAYEQRVGRGGVTACLVLAKSATEGCQRMPLAPFDQTLKSGFRQRMPKGANCVSLRTVTGQIYTCCPW